MIHRPNILVFLTDDHAQWASHPYGNSEIHSPTLDYLAARGVRLTSASTPCPVCSPARACFWTGKIPSAHGLHDYLQEPGHLDHPGIAGQTTLAEHLKAGGYHTGLIGKWHCGRYWQPFPGFDTWFTLATGTNARFGPQPFLEGTERIEHHGYQAPVLTDRVIRFLRERPAAKPFFLFVGYTDTHTPHSGSPSRLVEFYRDAGFADVPVETFSQAHGFARMPWTSDLAARRSQLANYYAAVTLIDEQIGRILDELESRGELAETLVVYTSDHGHMNGHHGLHSKGNATIPQNFLDESIRVPLLLSWPDYLPRGITRNEPVDHCDLFATLLHAAGCDAPAIAARDCLPGRSYLTLLTGTDPNWRHLQFCEYGNARMVRSDTAKLIRRYPGPNGNHPDEFYDLAADPREVSNELGNPVHASVISQLDAALAAHFARYEVPAHSATHIADLPACNDAQPWVLTSEAVLAQRARGKP